MVAGNESRERRQLGEFQRLETDFEVHAVGGERGCRSAARAIERRACDAVEFAERGFSSRAATPPLPRSYSSRYFATVQPWFSWPTRLATGTRTSSKNT